jgi:phospholipid/cholesterol/gamma-HCH transport system substrate-binding protein
VAGLAAVILAVVIVAVLLVGKGGKDYTVKADFQNAGQIVKGDLVQVSGVKAGKVTDIDLTPNGQAQLTLHMDDDYAPLREGTDATIRQASLSGIANRYVDLRLPPQSAPKIPDGGVITSDHTTTAVDLDQLFNVFDGKTRKALTRLIRGLGTTYAGRGAEANAGFLYFNPALVATSRLFRELDRDKGLFKRFIDENANLVTDIAERRADLAGLVDHLATTTGAIGRQKTALADAISRLPAFMRRANTTFVNLRAALDDLKPLVDASKPVAKKLGPFLRELRPLAQDAQPTIHDLAVLIKHKGRNNDLIELTKGTVPLRDVAIGPVQANGQQREGAFPASTKALASSTPELAYGRPYAVDLTAWFDDFSHSGVYDANGGAARAAPHVNAFANVNGVLTPVPPAVRGDLFQAGGVFNQNDRCPGALEHAQPDGSVPFKPSPDFNCDEKQILPGK